MKLLFIPILSLAAWAQTISGPGKFSGPLTLAPGTPVITLINHGSATGTGTGNGTATTSAIDMTGANFLFLACMHYQGGNSCVPTDSSSNTWVPLTAIFDASFSWMETWYCFPCTAGATQTFTGTAGTNGHASIKVAGFSNVATPPLDQQNQAASATTSTTIQSGSITPSANKYLVLAAVEWGLGNTGNTVSIDSGFTILDQNTYPGFTFAGGALAYLVQTTATAENPTWTLSASSDSRAAQTVSFK